MRPDFVRRFSSACNSFVTRPFLPWLPSSVVTRTSQPSAWNSFSHRMSTRRRADEDDAFLRRALGQQIHRRHAVTARDEQGVSPPRFGTVNPWPSGAITLSSSPACIRARTSVPLPTVL